jgi:PKD repeat protein
MQHTTLWTELSSRFSYKNQLWQFGILLFIIFFASACNLLKGDKHTDLVAEGETPIASFSISVQSGKAPLAVDFTDSSQITTSTITSWSWSFGDGGSSSEQNPQYVFQTAGTYDVSLTVTSADGSDTDTQLSAITVEAADTKTKITLVDAKGLALTEVTATSEVFSIESQSYNELNQLSVNLRPSESQGVIRLSKEGYADNLIYVENSKYSKTISATMLKRTPAIVFDGFLGGELVGVDGASVTIPPEALIKPDGTLVTGNVELYITPVDTSDPIKSKAFPGSFYGLPQADQLPAGEEPQQQLFSYGVVEYSFYADGEKLQLRDGMQAELQLPLYTTKNIYEEDLVLGGTIPLWTLNETTGLWEQQGEGTIIANPVAASGFSLSATTTHFSWFNTDAWAGSNSGSLSAARNPANCNVTINIIGVSVGELFEFKLSNGFLSGPSSNLANLIVYDAKPIETRFPTGALITTTARRGDQSVSRNVACFATTIEFDLVLPETAPEFFAWDLKAIPKFSKETSTSLYEIQENEVLIGGTFFGDDTVEVQSNLVGAEILTLPNQQFFAAQYTTADITPTQITSTLSNAIDTVEDISFIDYIHSHSPLLEYFIVTKTVDNFSLEFRWSVEGADNATVYYLGEDPSSIGVVVFHIEDMEAGSIINSQLIDLPGFVRIDFSNQYGNTVVIGRLSELNCLPGSENCPVN